MNKQELIKKIETLPAYNAIYRPWIDKGTVLDFVEQLDEPKKVKIPQFVADWYEENKDDFEGNLFRCAHNIPSIFDSAKLNEFEKWFLNVSTKPFQILVNMHQFGYEVEKEKWYLVKVVGMNRINGCLSYNKNLDKWFFGAVTDQKPYRTKHTRKQLEQAGFGWVFSCEGVEVEEVEE
nr:MAG TPA: Protein of unknown function (DUF1642) [Caudoviricetes sp.]